jgi:hypothetical protein
MYNNRIFHDNKNKAELSDLLDVEEVC